MVFHAWSTYIPSEVRDFCAHRAEGHLMEPISLEPVQSTVEDWSDEIPTDEPDQHSNMSEACKISCQLNCNPNEDKLSMKNTIICFSFTNELLLYTWLML